MRKRNGNKNQRSLSWILVVLFFLLVFSCQTVEKHGESETNIDLDRFNRAAEIIFEEYVDPIPAHKLIAWSLDGIQKNLNSRVLIEDENNSSLNSKSPLGYNFRSSNDSEDVKTGFRTLLSDKALVFWGFSSKDIVDSAIRSMLTHMDPQCALLRPDELQRVKTDSKGESTGIGIVITMKDRFVTAVFSIKGSPAQRVGIVAGDRIERVNGCNVEGIWEVAREINEAHGEKTTLTISRKNIEGTIDYEIVPEVIPNKSVHTRMLRSGFGYAWIGSFDENTASDLETALAALDGEDRPLQGLILDLRGNPGGLLSQAIQVSDLFLEKGNIVSVKGRIKRNTREFKAHPNAVRRSYPVVLLINEGSASAAEILASALQENNRALVLGKRSYGKGSIQAVEGIGGGYGIKITIARYYTPKGNLIQGRGVVPDVFISSKVTGKLREGTSDESGLTNDPAIEIALLTLQRANSSDFCDLLSAARNAMNEKKGVLSIKENADTKEGRDLVSGINSFRLTI